MPPWLMRSLSSSLHVLFQEQSSSPWSGSFVVCILGQVTDTAFVEREEHLSDHHLISTTSHVVSDDHQRGIPKGLARLNRCVTSYGYLENVVVMQSAGRLFSADWAEHLP